MKKKTNGTNQLQARYLRDRINAAYYDQCKRLYALGDMKEPAQVTQARRVIAAFDKERRRRMDKAQDGAKNRLNKDAQRVRELILFQPAPVALKAVQDFEAREL